MTHGWLQRQMDHVIIAEAERRRKKLEHELAEGYIANGVLARQIAEELAFTDSDIRLMPGRCVRCRRSHPRPRRAEGRKT